MSHHSKKRTAAAMVASAAVVGAAVMVAPVANAADIVVQGAPTAVERPGWSLDAVKLPATAGVVWTAKSGEDTLWEDGKSGDTKKLFVNKPDAAKTTVTLVASPLGSGDTVKAVTYEPLRFNTSQVPVTIALNAEPRAIDVAMTGYDTVVVTKVAGVKWTITPAGVTPATDIVVKPEDFYAGATKNVTLPSGSTSAIVKAEALGAEYAFATSMPMGTEWEYAFVAGAAEIAVSAAQKPIFVDHPGLTKDAITLTPVPGAQWTINGKAVDLAAKPRTILLSSPEVDTLAADDSGRAKYTVKAGPSGPNHVEPSTALTFDHDFGRAPITVDVERAADCVQLTDGPADADSLTIMSPSDGLAWTVNGLAVRTPVGKPVKVPTKGAASVVVVAKPASDDYALSTGTQWSKTYAFTTGATSVTVTAPVRAGASLKVTAVDNVAWKINGKAVTLPAGVLSKTFAVPATGDVTVVATAKSGFAVKVGSSDPATTFTWTLTP